MNSLSGLLSKVLQLPPHELQPRTPQSERPNEMALLAQVLPPAQIKDWWDTRSVSVRRACFIRHGGPEIEFHVINGTTNHIIASFDSKHGVRVTDNGVALPIDSVEKLREHIISTATKKRDGYDRPAA